MGVQEIGFSLDFNEGTLDSLEITSGNRLQLQSALEGFFLPKGTWTSNIIDLEGKYTSLENLAMDKIVEDGQALKAMTRTSEDGENWDEYVEIDYETGKMRSVPRRYVQVHIELSAIIGDGGANFVHTDFKDNLEVQENPFTEVNNGLRLKTNYDIQMDKQNWEDEGNVFRKTVRKEDFKRIDSIRVQ